MRALVTGAHGSVGSHLVEELLRHGHEVRGLVSPWGGLDNLSAVLGHPKLELVRADVTDPASLGGMCDGLEVVYHAAAKVAEWGPWEEFFETNVRGTQHLLAEAERRSVGRFVQVSSVAVHRYTGFRGADPRALPREGGANAYARSKRLAEDVVRAAGLETVIVRPGLWLYGPRDPLFIRQVEALERGTLPLVAGGRAVVNPCYVGNLALGLRLAGTVPGAAGRSYVIADEGSPSWRELFTTLAELLGAPKPRLSLPGGVAKATGFLVEQGWARLLPGRQPPLTYYMAYVVADDVHFSLEAAGELGYRPRVGWREGLARTVAALGAR